MPSIEDVIGAQSELRLVSFMVDCKAFDGDPVDGVRSGRILVAPRQVIVSAGGEHAHLGVARQMLGDVPRVQLGAAVDVGAVPLHDDRYPHSSGGVAGSSLRTGSGAGSGARTGSGSGSGWGAETTASS